MGVILSTLLYAALRIAGITDRPGRGPSNVLVDPQYKDVFAIYNRMVGSWSNIKLNIFTILISQYNLVANTQKYTIGPGGTGPAWINAARPIKIERANLFITSSPSVVRRGMRLLEPADWAAKQVLNVNGPPLELFDDYASPLSTLYFWPIPAIVYPFELHTWSAVPTAVTVNDLVQLPPGYEEAIVYNLAKRVAGQFKSQGARMSPEDLDIARSSLSAIQSRNTQSPRLMNDAAGLGSSGGTRSDFNWITGQPE
jgi:hypothetical protein